MTATNASHNGAIAASEPEPVAPAVAAQDVTRRYGEGEFAVDALRGVSSRSRAASSPPSWARRAPASRR